MSHAGAAAQGLPGSHGTSGWIEFAVYVVVGLIVMRVAGRWSARDDSTPFDSVLIGFMAGIFWPVIAAIAAVWFVLHGWIACDLPRIVKRRRPDHDRIAELEAEVERYRHADGEL